MKQKLAIDTSITGDSFFGPYIPINVTTPSNLELIAKMDRGFFLFQGDFVCYRRNYFQLSVGVAGMDGCYVNGKPIARLEVSLRARVFGSEKEIALVQHTPKRDKGPQMKTERKQIVVGGDPYSYASSSNHIVTFERIQFKSATANNGKRRAAQQFFSVFVELHAVDDAGSSYFLGYCESAPLIVRGRSPSHYSDNLGSASMESFSAQEQPLSSAASVSSPFQQSASMFRFTPYGNHGDSSEEFTWIRQRNDSNNSFATNESYQSMEGGEYASSPSAPPMSFTGYEENFENRLNLDLPIPKLPFAQHTDRFDFPTILNPIQNDREVFESLSYDQHVRSVSNSAYTADEDFQMPGIFKDYDYLPQKLEYHELALGNGYPNDLKD
jgi:hypothetical protein